MTSQTSPTADEDGPFELSKIFIGREQQLDLFDVYLDRWQRLMANASPVESPVTTSPSPNNRIQGLIVLLYGRGGFGKTTLLQRYHTIVSQDNRHFLISKIVDWEFAIEGMRGLFSPSAGQEVDATEYFKMLCDRLAIALDKKPQAFEEYQAAARDVANGRKEASGVLDTLQKDDRFGWLRNLTVEGILFAVRTHLPGSSLILENEKVKEAAYAAGKTTEEQVSQIFARLRDKLGSKISDILDPTLRLGLALGRDLHKFARNFPLLIFFDTYEEIDEGDRLLRMVMGAAGIRVGWVITGRDNLWAGQDQIERSIALEYGYKEIVPSDRGLPVDFNVGGVGAFTASDIKDYFDLLCKMVPYPLPKVPVEGAKRILDATKGVPLAVKLAAGLYMRTADLDTITENVEGKREIVDQMVLRYLLHARDNQTELAKLYGLAMVRHADEPTAVVAALGLTPEQARMSYASELSRLQRRYSFIFNEKDEPSLHQEVRTFLRLWLSERSQQPEIQAINEQLKGALEATLKRLEEQRTYPTLSARFEDERWVETYLNLAEQVFWLDPVEGMRFALPFMIAADRYRPFASNEMIDIGEFFHTKIESPYVGWWELATANFKSVAHVEQWIIVTKFFKNVHPIDNRQKLLTEKLMSVDPSFLREKSHQIENLARIIHQQNIGFPVPLTNFRDEVEALLWWRLGEVDEQKAVEWYEKALTLLGSESALRKAATRAYWNMARKLRGEKKVVEGLPLLNRAIDLTPDDAAAYTSRGAIYRQLQEYTKALEDYTQAIMLDPFSSYPYTGRGAVYRDLREYQQACEDYSHAIELDPSNVSPYTGRGAVYRQLRKYQRALEDYARAIEINPNDVYLYHGRGAVYYDLREYQRALEDYTRSIELNPNNAYPYTGRGMAYLQLKDTMRAQADLSVACERDPRNIKTQWLAVWASFGKRRVGGEIADRLEKIAAADAQQYYAYICRAVASGLRGRLKEGLEEVEQALTLLPEEWDAYFWKGMLRAYYYQTGYHMTIDAIEKSLERGLPPLLLLPLYWLEQERSGFFEKYALPLLKKHDV
jgi:tetratricopeptide (TPR) repeat protein